MTTFKADEPARAKMLRTKAEEAIAYALRNKWAEAAATNRAILEVTPEDIDALNRLAKALLELGALDEARDAVNRAVALSPNHPIARKNAERLMRADGQRADAAAVNGEDNPGNASFSLDLFMEEAGKTTTATLVEPGQEPVVQRLSSGEPVQLVQDGNRLIVRSRRNEYVGRVQPRLAQRLITLMEGGNRYAAAVLQVTEQEVRIIVREVYQAPEMAGRPSFPALRPDGFRPYVRGGRGLVYYDLAESSLDAPDEGDEGEDGLEERRPRPFTTSEDDEEEPDD